MTKTDWRHRIRVAEKVGTFTSEDKQLSADFCSCAVGEAFIRPRARRLHISLDDAMRSARGPLVRLGMDFWHAVETNDIPAAKRLQAQIARAVKRGTLPRGRPPKRKRKK